MDEILNIITDTMFLIMVRAERLQKVMKLSAPTQLLEAEKRGFRESIVKKIEQLITEIERQNA